VNFLSTQWSKDGLTSSEPMGLCITSIIKALTDNHTLDDRNHQGHHTYQRLCCPQPKQSLCVGEVRSLESTGSPCGEFWSQISTCILTGYRLNKSLHLTTWGSEWSCVSGLATRLTLCQTFLTMSGFRTRHIFCCEVTWTLRTTSSGVGHPLSTVCKGHYTLWSALPGLPSPNISSLDHSGSRTTTSSLWQSTPTDMSRCLASSGQHLVDREGSSGPSSGSSRMVPPPHLKRIIGMVTAAFPWPTDQPQLWPAVIAAFTGLEPLRFYMWWYLKDRVHGNNLQIIPDLKAAITVAPRAIPREECGRVIENFARQIQMCLERRGLIWSTFFERQWNKEFL